jgi:hypothetical protein
MKKFVFVTVAAVLLATSALAQSGGDNPGGRGVTSTGGPTGVTGKEPNGMKAPPATTGTGTGVQPMATGSAAGNNANSTGGPNSANSGGLNASEGRTSGGGAGAGGSGH